MKTSSILLIISNLFSLLSFIAFAYSYCVKEKRLFLLVRSVSNLLMVFVYCIIGLWISAVVFISMLIRDIYNAKTENPKMCINIIILIISVIIGVIESLHGGDLRFFTIWPIFSLVGYSIAVWTIKSVMGLQIINFIDFGVWIGYDLVNMLVFNVLKDVFVIVMVGINALIVYLDRKYKFVRVNKKSRTEALLSDSDIR